LKFKIKDNATNRKILSILKVDEVSTDGKWLVVKNKYSLEFDKLVLGSAIPTLSDKEWLSLYRDVSRTLEGGRIWPAKYRFDKRETWMFKIIPLKTKQLIVRMDPLEFEELKEAAKLAGKTISDFVRGAVDKAIDEEFDKMVNNEQAKQEQKRKPYVG
jgi:predicted DNA-binding protein